MRPILALTLILAVLYGGYWFVGAGTVESRARAELAALDARGWEVQYDTLDTRGFPSRFDTTVTDLSLSSPDGLFSYAAPFVQAFALSYRPNRLIVVFPPEQDMVLSGRPMTLGAVDMRMSASVRASTDLPFEAATLTVESPTLTGDGQPDTSAENILVAARHVEETEATYDLYAKADDLTLPPEVLSGLGAADTLPPRIDSVTLALRAALDAPLDRLAAQRPPLIQTLALDGTAMQ